MQAPTITPEDLSAFHAKHFANAPAPTALTYRATANSEQDYVEEYVEEYVEDGEDGLGYYPDGVKRTLTDEQIAMFRHSEIQRIIRDRLYRREAGKLSPEPETKLTPQPQPNSPSILGDAEHSAPSGMVSSQQSPVDTTEVMSPPISVAAGPSVRGGSADNVQTGRVGKPNQWKKATKTPAQKKKQRDRYKNKKRGARDDRQKLRENGGDRCAGSESDEWDPWNQANGPDNQKDTSVELDY